MILILILLLKFNRVRNTVFLTLFLGRPPRVFLALFLGRLRLLPRTANPQA